VSELQSEEAIDFSVVCREGDPPPPVAGSCLRSRPTLPPLRLLAFQLALLEERFSRDALGPSQHHLVFVLRAAALPRRLLRVFAFAFLDEVLPLGTRASQNRLVFP
jgi:hypothetical protein